MEVVQSALPLYLNGNTQPLMQRTTPPWLYHVDVLCLPISLMLIGKHFDEPTIYRAAHAFQESINTGKQFKIKGLFL